MKLKCRSIIVANCELSSHLVGRGFELVRLNVLKDHLALLLQLSVQRHRLIIV